MKKDTYIVFGEWEDNLVDLTQKEKGDILDALFAYWRRGEKPVFTDRAMRNVWRPMESAIDRTNEAYEAQCEVNRENGKKGGAPVGNQNAKKYPKTTKTTKTTETSETTLPDRDPDRDPQRDRGRGGDSERESPAEATTNTTTTSLQEQIIQEWNQHDFVQKIKRVDNPEARWLKTLQAIRNAGSEDEYLNVIRSLADHAYFRDQNKKGYRLVYDWFVDPENFQNVLEGKYAKSRDKFGDGWEVVEFG